MAFSDEVRTVLLDASTQAVFSSAEITKAVNDNHNTERA